jgi:hypothetical protein
MKKKIIDSVISLLEMKKGAVGLIDRRYQFSSCTFAVDKKITVPMFFNQI